MEKTRRKVLIVTGLSGAGLSTTLNMLEDLGWKAIDNLPLSLIHSLLEDKMGQDSPVAIGVDCRTWDLDVPRLLREVDELKKQKAMDVQLVFIGCDVAVLQRRFTETRRLHPLAEDRPVADGVAAESKRMQGINGAADIFIDTTDFKASDLKRHVTGLFALDRGHGLLVCVQSFGFKNGSPRDADMMFDVRFLDNPHWDQTLRPLTGLQEAVSERVKGDKSYRPFFDNLTQLLSPLLPLYRQEGKSYLTIAIGCTGGRHRSVTVAEDLFLWLKQGAYNVTINHRDLGAGDILNKSHL